MNKLIILRGNSGSGKTTIAKELQSKFGRNTMIISQDVIRRDMLKVKDGENSEAIHLMMELLRYGSKYCNIVILEGIMYAVWYKPLFELAVQIYGREIFAYYFDIPFEETIRRHQTKPNCKDFGPKDMQKWWKEKDYSNILQEETITSELDVSKIISNIYVAVTKL
jgi:predicted kinase